MSARVLAVIVLCGMFLFILDLVRREKLTFRYAFAWMIAVFAALVMAVAGGVCERIARAFGFALVSNFVFFVCAVAGVLLGLVITVFLCQQSQRNEMMAKKIALLEERLDNRKPDNI